MRRDQMRRKEEIREEEITQKRGKKRKREKEKRRTWRLESYVELRENFKCRGEKEKIKFQWFKILSGD